MARWETLMARDGHEFAAYLAPAQGTPRGAIVVLQEIFGVNERIRVREIRVIDDTGTQLGIMPPPKNNH